MCCGRIRRCMAGKAKSVLFVPRVGSTPRRAGRISPIRLTPSLVGHGKGFAQGIPPGAATAGRLHLTSARRWIRLACRWIRIVPACESAIRNCSAAIIRTATAATVPWNTSSGKLWMLTNYCGNRRFLPERTSASSEMRPIKCRSKTTVRQLLTPAP